MSKLIDGESEMDCLSRIDSPPMVENRIKKSRRRYKKPSPAAMDEPLSEEPKPEEKPMLYDIQRRLDTAATPLMQDFMEFECPKKEIKSLRKSPEVDLDMNDFDNEIGSPTSILKNKGNRTVKNARF
jgi:hypothetical protein